MNITLQIAEKEKFQFQFHTMIVDADFTSKLDFSIRGTKSN